MNISEKQDSTQTLFDFKDKQDTVTWNAVNDNVMGGVSEGKAVISDDNCLVFSGALSLENNGGFSSIRSLPDTYNLDQFKGIRIKIKGDGRTYQFRLRTNRNFDGVAFKQEFATVQDEWLEIDLPFESFLPSFRGRILRDEPPLDPSEIKQFGFLIADKNEGPFKLIVDEIAVYK